MIEKVRGTFDGLLYSVQCDDERCNFDQDVLAVDFKDLKSELTNMGWLVKEADNSRALIYCPDPDCQEGRV